MGNPLFGDKIKTRAEGLVSFPEQSFLETKTLVQNNISELASISKDFLEYRSLDLTLDTNRCKELCEAEFLKAFDSAKFRSFNLSGKLDSLERRSLLQEFDSLLEEALGKAIDSKEFNFYEFTRNLGNNAFLNVIEKQPLFEKIALPLTEQHIPFYKQAFTKSCDFDKQTAAFNTTRKLLTGKEKVHGIDTTNYLNTVIKNLLVRDFVVKDLALELGIDSPEIGYEIIATEAKTQSYEAGTARKMHLVDQGKARCGYQGVLHSQGKGFWAVFDNKAVKSDFVRLRSIWEGMYAGGEYHTRCKQCEPFAHLHPKATTEGLFSADFATEQEEAMMISSASVHIERRMQGTLPEKMTMKQWETLQAKTKKEAVPAVLDWFGDRLVEISKTEPEKVWVVLTGFGRTSAFDDLPTLDKPLVTKLLDHYQYGPQAQSGANGVFKAAREQLHRTNG